MRRLPSTSRLSAHPINNATEKGDSTVQPRSLTSATL
eukprot:CAMPEP_0197536374 /NCGR_PEP_ID=MMETSP1318-20131121/53703_1 /TAXON_ID=552666 /ORGANISM="Partenskyella glossopodia, Strain RCC365" /LENGTH=36 /DNA_ID= /DNA_START= /DNA_END= /DNA_ORIENTATION=